MKKPQKPILLINQMLQNQRRITQLRLRILAQTRTTQVLLSLQTAVTVQTQTVLSLLNIHTTGWLNIRL